LKTGFHNHHKKENARLHAGINYKQN